MMRVGAAVLTFMMMLSATAHAETVHLVCAGWHLMPNAKMKDVALNELDNVHVQVDFDQGIVRGIAGGKLKIERASQSYIVVSGEELGFGGKKVFYSGGIDRINGKTFIQASHKPGAVDFEDVIFMWDVTCKPGRPIF